MSQGTFIILTTGQKCNKRWHSANNVFTATFAETIFCDQQKRDKDTWDPFFKATFTCEVSRNVSDIGPPANVDK